MPVNKKVTVKNKTGLHARPASLFVQRANQFESDIQVELAGKEVNAKSIMGIMSLGAGLGKEIMIKASGSDESEAVNSLIELVEDELPEIDE